MIRIGENQFKTIEINAFGADLRTGGGLFHWGIDHDIIYGKSACELRVCVGGSESAGQFLIKKI